MGGPTGRLLIERRKLLDTVVPEDDSLLVEEEIKHERHTSMYPAAVFQLIIAIGIGTFISKALAMTGLTFPIYIGAMIAAACMRNIGEFTHKSRPTWARSTTSAASACRCSWALP